MLVAKQIEFSMRVPVCAWCKPVERGTGLGAISHGICPRHLRMLEREIKGIHTKPLTHRRKYSAGPMLGL